MNRDRKIDYIEFVATNIEATKKFYGKVFVWKFEDYGTDYASFQDGRTAGGFKREGTVSKGPLVVIYMDDLVGTEKNVRSAGGKISKEIFSFSGGSCSILWILTGMNWRHGMKTETGHRQVFGRPSSPASSLNALKRAKRAAIGPLNK